MQPRRCLRATLGAANVERDALVRNHLLQEQSDRVTRLEAARRQHPDGISFECGIDAGTNDSILHVPQCSYVL